MSSRQTYILANHPELYCITPIVGKSLPFVLGFSLLEQISRLHPTRPSKLKPLISALDELIQQAILEYPTGSDYITYFSSVYSHLRTMQHPNAALDFLDSITIGNQYENKEQEVLYLNQASKCLMATLLKQKLIASDQAEKINLFFDDNDMKDITAMLFYKFTEYFMVNIKLYQGQGSEIYTNPKTGSFPLIHLYKEATSYSLAYTQEMYDLRSNPEFNLTKLDNAPFINGKESHCPIVPPKPVSQPIVEIDFSNDTEALTAMVDVMCKGLVESGIYPTAVTNLVRKAIEKNAKIRSMQSIMSYNSNAMASLNGNMSSTMCSSCKRSLPATCFLPTIHPQCRVCSDCCQDIRYSSRCPKCSCPFNADERRTLRLP